MGVSMPAASLRARTLDDDDKLAAISDVYRSWATGGLSMEDALFEIGDLIQAPPPERGKTGAGPAPVFSPRKP
jgi:hypothetical protein